MSSKQLIQNLAEMAQINLREDIEIISPFFFDEVLSGGSLAFGETYMKGWWRSNLRLDILAERIGRAHLTERFREKSWIQQGKLIWNYFSSRMTSSIEQIWTNWGIENSKQVATEHYDLGNELYQAMLDPSMTYSCGYFKQYQDQLAAGQMVDLINQPQSQAELAQAQLNKMELIRQKLQLKPGQHVLDLGCGWGALSNYLATESQVIVDGLTISREQVDWARHHYAQNFYLDDYRNLLTQPGGMYDAVVSVGMFEHVNPPHYPEFMRIVHHVLKPGGIFLLHTIGGNVSKLVGDPWISKYIFPHSCLPSMAQLSAATERLFVIEDVHNIGPHYDLTLQCWYNNFKASFDEINQDRVENGRAAFSPSFYRMWEYYLLMCAGMFRARQCQLYQVILSKDRTGSYNRPNF